jgi:hypothetical protein
MLCHCSRPAHIWYVSRPFLILLLIQSKLKQAGQQIGVEGLPMPCVSPELGAAETFGEGGSGGIYRGVERRVGSSSFPPAAASAPQPSFGLPPPPSQEGGLWRPERWTSGPPASRNAGAQALEEGHAASRNTPGVRIPVIALPRREPLWLPIESALPLVPSSRIAGSRVGDLSTLT